MGVDLRTKFQVSIIILTSFSQGKGVILPQKRAPKKPTQIRVKPKTLYWTAIGH